MDNNLRRSASYKDVCETRSSVKNQVIAAVLINISQLAQGSALGWMSPMAVRLQQPDSPSGSAMSSDFVFWAASILWLAAGIGLPIIGFISQKYGRRPAAILTCIPIAMSWLLVTAYLNHWTLVISRILAGITCLSSYFICSLYIGETANSRIRGTLTSMVMFVNTTGVIIGYAFGGYLHYRVAAPLLLVFPVAHIVAFMLLPETPVHLVKQGKIEDAKKCLGFFTSLPDYHEEVETEIEKLIQKEEENKKRSKLSLREMFRDDCNRKSFIIVSILGYIITINGAAVVVNYSSVIFAAAFNVSHGQSGGLSSTLSSIVIGIVMLFGSTLSCITIDKFGRKPLLMVSFAICSLSIGGLGVWFFLTTRQIAVPGWIPLVLLGSFMISNIAGPGTIHHVMLGEMFKFEVRSLFSTIHYTSVGFVIFISLFTFNPLIQLIGVHFTMWIFAAINIIGLLFTKFFLPETKQRTLDQISEEMVKKPLLDRMKLRN